MFPTVNAAPTADEKVARLVKQGTLNLAMHLRRLYAATDGFSTAVESINGPKRDYVVSVLYTINETLALLNFTGSQEHVDAIFLTNLDARDYYDEAINVVHAALAKDPTLQAFETQFDNEMKTLKPDLKEPMPDDLGDDAHLTEGDRAKLAGEPGLEEMAGNPVDPDQQVDDEYGLDEEYIDPTEDTDLGLNNSDERAE